MLLKIFVVLLITFLRGTSERTNSTVESKDVTFNIDFHQNDYTLIPERLELVRYNKKYARSFEIKTFKYNRTCTAFNVSFSFNSNLGYNLEVILQAYRFRSNEYRYFPMRFEWNFCSIIPMDVFGTSRLLKCGDFSGCPLLKGRVYRICNWVPDQTRFPPLIPSGQYMFELQGVYFSEEVYLSRGYVSITRPFGKD